MASNRSEFGGQPKWPSREAHLSPSSDSDTKFMVDSRAPKESANTKRSPFQSKVQEQLGIPAENNRPKKDISIEDWNPMQEAYNDKSFNTYNRGPASGLSGVGSGRPARNKTGKFVLYVGGIPTEMTEDGLSNLFSHVCDIQRVSVCRPKDEDADFTFGFVDISSVKDGEEAIRRLDGHVIRNRRLKVAFKKDKEKPVEVVLPKQDLADDWDPPPARNSASNKPSSSAQRPKSKSRSRHSGKSSSGGSESEGSTTDMARKRPPMRKLEDRYGIPKPKTPEQSKVTSPTGLGTREQVRSPVQESKESVAGAGHKTESPLQALLKKMKGSRPEDGKTVKDLTPSFGSTKTPVQTLPSQEAQRPAAVGDEASGYGGRRTDLSKREVAADSSSSLKQAFAEKLNKAGIVLPKDGQISEFPRSTAPASDRKVAEDGSSSPTKPKPLLSLSHKVEHPDNSDQRDSDMRRGQNAVSPSWNKGKRQFQRNEPDGILGAPPLFQNPPPMGGPCYCPECPTHEYHEAEAYGAYHPRPHTHHHQHPGPPRNGPYTVPHHPGEDPYYMHPPHPQGMPHRSMQYPQGPHYGPEPPYPRPRFHGGIHQYPQRHSYPQQHGYHEGRGYPHGHLGSAGYQNSGFQFNRAKPAPGARGKPESPASQSRVKTFAQESIPPTDESTATQKPPTSTAEIPAGKISAKNPLAADNQENTTRPPFKDATSDQTDKALPNPEGDTNAKNMSSSGKSLAGGEGQRSKSKGQTGRTGPELCINCGKEGTLRCANCKETYCSQDCQKRHWPTHKPQCRKISSPAGSQAGTKSSSSKSPSSTPPRKITEVLHSGLQGQFMARNLPFETPDNKEMDVLVTEVESPSSLWVQLVQERSVTGFSKICDDLAAAYSDQPSSEDLSYVPKVGSVCAVLYSEDENWYRAELVSINNDRYQVRLIDFGNVDTVSKVNLRQLREQMLKLPKQALRCSLSGIKPLRGPWSKDAIYMVQSLVNKDGGCSRSKFIGQGPEGQEIEIYTAEDHAKTVSSVLISAGLAQPASSATPNTSAHSPKNAPPPALPPASSLGSVLDDLMVGMRVDICISQVDSPGCFYANMAESALALQDLDQQMNDLYADRPPVKGFRPLPGELCAARFSLNNMWYRAVVEEPSPSIKDPSQLSVTFIDYGNSETVSIQECRPLEASLSTLSKQAVPCGLAGVGPTSSEGWPEEMTEAFKEWVVDGRTSIVVKSKSSCKVNVEIFSPQSEMPETSFNAILQNFGFNLSDADAQASATAPGESTPDLGSGSLPRRSLPPAEHPQTEFQGFVTIVNDPSDFYLQVDSDANRETFRTLMEHLNTRYTLQDFDSYKPKIGEACAAIYSDNAWYRAIALEYVAPESAFKVLFVDYGNVEMLPSDKIRVLEDRFYVMPIMALHCSLTCLPAPSSGDKVQWNKAAITHFTEKVLNKPCHVSVVRNQDGLCEVELLYSGADDNTNYLSSVKRELIQQGWALLQSSPTSNRVHASGSGDRRHSNQMSPVSVVQSGDAPSANGVMRQTKSGNRKLPDIPAGKPPSEDFCGLVTVVGNCGDVYLQVATDENAEILQSLMGELNQYYGQMQQRPHVPEVGEFCAVKYSLDQTWYRGQVTSKLTNEEAAVVLFVDFGNTDTVMVDDIRKLDEEFMMTPLLALHCRLSSLQASAGGQSWRTDTLQHLQKMILEKLCKVYVTKHDGKVFEVDIHYSNDDNVWKSINKELIQTGLAEPIRIQSHSPGPSGDHSSANEASKRSSPVKPVANEREVHSQSKSPRSSGDNSVANQHIPGGSPKGGLTNEVPHVTSGGTPETELAQLPAGDPPPAEFIGVMTAVTNPCDFYLQIKNEMFIQLSLLLREELNKSYRSPAKRPHVPKVGELCAAMYSADNEWYRALALEQLHPEAFRVMFLDYGNCETVEVDKLQRLEGDFLEVPQLAYHCCLNDVMAPSGDQHGPWSPKSAAYISKELMEKDKECQVRLVKHAGKVCEVEIHYSSEDGQQVYFLRDELLREGLVRPLRMATTPATTPTKGSRILAKSVKKTSLPTDFAFKIVVNEVVSPQELYCQVAVKEEIDKLQTLMEDMASCSKSLSSPPSVGDLCLARFTGDDAWYRAEILKIKQSDKKALVYYVDFGNKEPLPWSRLADAEGRFTELAMQAVQCGLADISPHQTPDVETKAFLRDQLIGDGVIPKCFDAAVVSDDGIPLIKLIGPDNEDINQIVSDYYQRKQRETSPRTGSQPTPRTPSTSPAPTVVSPRVTTPDPAKLEALEAKRKMLEAQIEAQRRELAEVEKIRASLEQGL